MEALVTQTRLFVGDCVDVMAGLDADSVDMVLTSPPYDSMRKYNGFSFDLDAVINGIYRVLRKGGVCVWIVGDQLVRGQESCTSFKTALKFVEHGFSLHDTMIYHKRNSMPNIRNDRVRYHQSFEYMFCFSKGTPTKFNPITTACKHAGKTGGHTFRNHGKDELEARGSLTIKESRVVDNVFTYAVGASNTTTYRQAFRHPAVFPEKLAHDQIISWTDAGDVVLDPMCGSGTTIFCAHALGRDAIGIDISYEYIELTRKRLEEEKIPSWIGGIGEHH